METVLSVENVTKTFKISKKQQKIQKSSEQVKVAVSQAFLTAYDGEIYGLLGSNGAGKTTLLRMIATLIKSDTGSIKVLGKDVKDDPSFVRSNIAFLTSELKIEDYFTPDYLFEFYSKLQGVEEEVMQERKKYLFKKFGIDKFAEVKVSNMSQGMKQKTSLVMSIVHDPKLIVFDEPTNGLDILTAKVVIDFLLELKNQGKSIIVSSHIFSLIERICDRVAIVVEGKVVVEDTLKNVCKGKSLEDIFFEINDKHIGDRV